MKGGNTMILDIMELKNYIEHTGIKQKHISIKAKIPESQLSLILNGKRKCEVGEYASICNAIGAEIGKFIKPEPGQANDICAAGQKGE